MEPLDLTDEEAAALSTELTDITGNDRFPLSPRLAPLRVILAKLEPPAPQPERAPPLRPGLGPTHGHGRRQR
jgi:hypothetical protein